MKKTANFKLFIFALFLFFTPIQSQLIAYTPGPLSQQQMRDDLAQVNAQIKALEDEKNDIQKRSDKLQQQSDNIFFTDAFNSRVYGDQAQVMKNRAKDIDREIEKLKEKKRKLEIYVN